MDAQQAVGQLQQRRLDHQSIQQQLQNGHHVDGSRSSPPNNPNRPPGRPHPPTRSSTLGSPNELDRKHLRSNDDLHPHARSEDMSHSSANGYNASPASSPMPSFQSLSRPLTPNDSRSGASSSNHSETDGSGADDSTLRRLSATSLSSSPSAAESKAASSVSAASLPMPSTCASCSLPLDGAFVRALGNVWHLQCFKCKVRVFASLAVSGLPTSTSKDCDTIVASKFFPVEGSNGKQEPLCERDYFRRLNLICAKCGQALRGSYITACSMFTFSFLYLICSISYKLFFKDKKYHVEHFTCSVCTTVFGPQDSYYEHDNDVYCHFHYSTRFATKCAGCNSAILKQFVEINRNNRDECWHPECYMINKVSDLIVFAGTV